MMVSLGPSGGSTITSMTLVTSTSSTWVSVTTLVTSTGTSFVTSTSKTFSTSTCWVTTRVTSMVWGAAGEQAITAMAASTARTAVRASSLYLVNKVHSSIARA